MADDNLSRQKSRINFYAYTFKQLLKFIFLPSSIRQREKKIGANCIAIEYKRNGLPLIISFAGLGEQFNFGNSLSYLDANVIYLRDVNHNWYLNGLPGVGNKVIEITDFLAKKRIEYGAVKLLTIGVSAGGFGALLYGHLLKADVVLAFSPQTFMNRWKCIRFLDYRWLDRVVQIYEGDLSNRKYLDLSEVLKRSGAMAKIVFDITHRLDKAHALNMKGSNITHVIMKSGGHNLVQQMRDSGLLAKMIREAL